MRNTSETASPRPNSGLLLETVVQDLHYAARGFRRNPIFTLIALLTLTIGISATTAVFSVVDRLLFRSLPYRNADRLVSWGFTGPIDENEFMVGNSYVKWRGLLTPFQSVTSFSASVEAQGDLGDRNPIRITRMQVEANFLSTFGIAPVIGRDLTREDDQPGAPAVALVSHGLWLSRFGGAPAVLNRTVVLDDQPVRIVGVLPEGFEFPTLARPDILLPQQLDEAAQLRGGTRFLRTFGRLKDGVTVARAQQELQPFLQNTIRYDVPPSLRKEVHLVVRSVRDRQVGNVRVAALMLFGAVLALLLLACANVANLLLGRAAVRERELAMRAALGASRPRLIRQTLTESLLLSICGAMAGSILAAILLRVLAALAPPGIFGLEQARLDHRVFAFTLIVSIGAAVLFGIAPALERPKAEALAGWRTAGITREFLRHALVTAQMTVSLVLLAGAFLLSRSLLHLQQQSIGFEPSHTIVVSFQLVQRTYRTPEKLSAFYNQLEARLQQIPGETAFALTDSIPPSGWIHSRPFSNIAIVGKPPLPSEGGMVTFRYVSPDYFRLLRIPLLAGRGFDDRDRLPSQNSIILSAKLARRMFGDENPLGEHILLNPQGPPLAVVGVVANVKNEGLANPPDPEYYLPRKRSPDMGLGSRGAALIQSPLSAAELAPWIRSQVASVDPLLPITISTMEGRLAEETGRPRFFAVMLGLFAAFGLALASVGLYGVMAFLVSQQTREIGIRMAIGATPANIACHVFKHALTWIAVGAGAGLAASLALTRLARNLLFEVSPHDPISLFAAVAVLAFAGTVACWWPSYRASKVDPAVSLRHE